MTHVKQTRFDCRNDSYSLVRKSYNSLYDRKEGISAVDRSAWFASHRSESSDATPPGVKTI